VRFLRLGRAPLAIIAVGFSVAPADRNVGFVANLRNAHTRAGNVGAGALTRLRLAPQIRGTWDIGDAAASLANVGRTRAANEPNQHDKCQSHARGDRIWRHDRAKPFCRKSDLLQKTRPFAGNKTRAAWMSDARRISRQEEYAITISAGNASEANAYDSVRQIRAEHDQREPDRPPIGSPYRIAKAYTPRSEDRQFSAAAYVDEVASHEGQVSD
jgi:hypothetical protein